jgi:hypothetical protein
VREVEHPVSFKCGTFGASSAQDRHLATGNFKGDTCYTMVYSQIGSASELGHDGLTGGTSSFQ